MTRILLAGAFVLLVVAASAQEEKKSASAQLQAAASNATAKALETKIRKSWEDYKKRDKKAFSAILADDFAEVTNDAEGIFGKDTELSEMDHFNLAHYELRDFKLRPVGNSGAVITYTAEYGGTYDNTPVQMKTVYGEVWVKSGNDWKQLWVQETKVK